MEVVSTIERHLAKESQYVPLNETIGELPHTMLTSYRDFYFIAIDRVCTKFLTLAVLKLQHYQMDQCVENLYDEKLIELAELLQDTSHTNIKKLWIVSHIDQQKFHYVILLDNAVHLCTCLTLVNRGIICCHFFAVLLESNIAQFYIGIIAKRWFNDRVIEKNVGVNSEHAISIRNGQGFGTFKHEVRVDFCYIDSICGQYVFTPKVQHQLKSQALYGKGFGLMKKTLNLAIETRCTEELYRLHQRFIEEMEKQLAEKEGHIIQSNDKNDFYGTISNPLQSRMKRRKCHKRIASFNNSTGARKKVLKEATNI
ncbi:protein far1-related sequence 11-like [Gigaspora margarita]|nr:protein far1-related sequence 11-like [Gigaspora margarita]